jgi:hypothetical protein
MYMQAAGSESAPEIGNQLPIATGLQALEEYGGGDGGAQMHVDAGAAGAGAGVAAGSNARAVLRLLDSGEWESFESLATAAAAAGAANPDKGAQRISKSIRVGNGQAYGFTWKWAK